MKQFSHTLILSVVLGLPFIASVQAAFNHPGLLHSRADLERMRDMISRGQEPVKSGFEVFRSDPASQLDYRMRGPGEEIGRNPNVNFHEFDSDANAAYQLALMWAITGEKAYAEKAMEILNAWAGSMKRVSGRDAVLMGGLGPFKMVNAAEILRYTDAGWSEADVQRCERMFLDAVYPAVKDFALFANGNWDAAAIQTVMAIGVFCNDEAIFERGLRYYVSGAGNGRLTHYVINETGQCQESGRDQQHTQLGLALLAACCEVAWQQGLDLYACADYRLLKGFEYAARYNLGEEVPFVETVDRTGKYHHERISTKGRGRLRAVYEMVYNHYVNRAKMAAPYTQRAAEQVRPEGPGRPGADHPGFGTLLFTRAPEARPLEAGVSPLSPRVTSLLGSDKHGAVHDYGRPGDDPATPEVDESAVLASDDIVEDKWYPESTKFAMTVNETPVSIHKYKKGPDGSRFYNFDVARFASKDRTPEFKIQLQDETIINTVEIYPERYYPPQALSVSGDKKTLTFTLSEKLPYCIVNINGTLAEMAGIPMLAIINDPPETNKPDLKAGNVLNFKTFASDYLKEHPITDRAGDECRPAGTVTDTSRNTREQFTWHYEAGRYVNPKEKNVRFPDKRVRERRDVSEAFQAALKQ